MIEPRPPENESERLAALRTYDILDTAPEQAFDDLVRVAARICGTPIALVSLIDERRQWFKARIGLDAEETPRELAFCAHAILEPDQVLEVTDATRDPRFAGNPLVEGDPNVIFYAGAPLVTPQGLPLGTLCVIDHQPRQLDEQDLETLQCLARATVDQLELRKAATELRTISKELALSNEELQRRNTEIQRFYHTLSHELKTPLTIAREYVSLVIDGMAGPVPDDQRDLLTTSVESCDQLAAHVDDLLDVTRIETGKLRLEPRLLSVAKLVTGVVNGLRRSAEQAGIILTVATAPRLPRLLADERRVTQVLSNLLQNAIKFTPAGGTIHVEADRVDEGVRFQVRDTGRGIPAGDLERIFERLYQCADRQAPSQRGLGIGLHLCREIVRLHGGTISVESGEGSGSTFEFDLPAPDASASRLAAVVADGQDANGTVK